MDTVSTKCRKSHIYIDFILNDNLNEERVKSGAIKEDKDDMGEEAKGNP